MSLWDKLKRTITGYDELPETAVGLDGTITTPNRYKAQLQAQAQGLPANVVNGMAQGLNSGNTTADNLMKKYNAYEQPQVIHHNGLADGILGTPNKSVVAYDDKGQPLYSETERKGGLINDFAEGFRDNFNNRLSSSNLADNTMADGRQKNFINRIGEGFGTVGRILESPMGRSLLVGGLVGATGGSGLQALGYGLGTGMLNQQNRMKDRIYRRSLLEQTQRSIMNSPEYINAEDDKDENGNVIVSAQEKRQQMLDDAERQVNSYRGYIGDDTYKQVLTGMQLRDNAEYRNALLNSQLYNQEYQRQQKQAELDYKRNRDAKEDYYEEQKLAQGWAKIKQEKPLSDSQVKDLKGTMIFINALENIEKRYSDPKYNSMFGIKGDIRRNNPLSRYDAEASLFKQDVDVLRQRYAKLLEGGRLTDADRLFYQKVLFNPNISKKDFMEAVRRMKQTSIVDYKTSLDMYSRQGKNITSFEEPIEQNINNDPLGIR